MTSNQPSFEVLTKDNCCKIDLSPLCKDRHDICIESLDKKTFCQCRTHPQGSICLQVNA